MATEDTLQWEARRRPRAAVAALASAILILGSYVLSGVVFANAPRVSLGAVIGETARPGPVGAAPSLKVPFYEFYADRAGALLGASAARGIGFLLLGAVLTFLAYAIRARSPRFPKAVLYLPVVGSVLSALSYIASPIGTVSAVNSFLDGPRTIDAAGDVTSSSLVVTAAALEFIAGVVLALAFVFVCLNAMRAGLLTRFLGVLGMLAGALTFIPLGSPLPVVQCFWLAAIAWLLLGRWPGGDPPAWRTGQAEPWPTQQELREARERGDSPSSGRRSAPEPVAAAVAASPDPQRLPHPSSRKKKRKRRA